MQPALAHRGRHPSQETEEAILEATREILAKEGVRGLTIEGVAARSGVAKTTIYRRWRSKHDLALAVLFVMVEEQVQSSHDLGDTRAELIAFVNRAIKILNTTLMGRVMQGLVSDLAADPELAKAFRERVVTKRVEELARILERAIERGNIRRDADIDIANELLFGPVYYRLFLSGKPLNKDFAERTVDAFMAYARAGRSAPRR